MPVVRRGDHHGIYTLVLQDAAQILFDSCLSSLRSRQQLLARWKEVLVDIAKISDVYILEAGKRADQLPASPADASRHGRADADDREYYLVIRRVGSSRIGERRQTCDANPRSLQKMAAVDRNH